jgi:tetratricopeptide (TPR) repeat protein
MAFDNAERTKNQPKSADIFLKVNYGRGRVSLVRYWWFERSNEIQKALDQLQEASAYFHMVLELGKDSDRVAERVALAHGFLGSIAVKQQPPDLETAKSEFQIAIDTVESHRAKAGFYAQLGDVYIEEGLVENALNAYTFAVDTTPDEESKLSYRDKLDQLVSCHETITSSTTNFLPNLSECLSRN